MTTRDDSADHTHSTQRVEGHVNTEGDRVVPLRLPPRRHTRRAFFGVTLRSAVTGLGLAVTLGRTGTSVHGSTTCGPGQYNNCIGTHNICDTNDSNTCEAKAHNNCTGSDKNECTVASGSNSCGSGAFNNCIGSGGENSCSAASSNQCNGLVDGGTKNTCTASDNNTCGQYDSNACHISSDSSCSGIDRNYCGQDANKCSNAGASNVCSGSTDTVNYCFIGGNTCSGGAMNGCTGEALNICCFPGNNATCTPDAINMTRTDCTWT